MPGFGKRLDDGFLDFSGNVLGNLHLPSLAENLELVYGHAFRHYGRNGFDRNGNGFALRFLYGRAFALDAVYPVALVLLSVRQYGSSGPRVEEFDGLRVFRYEHSAFEGDVFRIAVRVFVAAATERLLIERGIDYFRALNEHVVLVVQVERNGSLLLDRIRGRLFVLGHGNLQVILDKVRSLYASSVSGQEKRGFRPRFLFPSTSGLRYDLDDRSRIAVRVGHGHVGEVGTFLVSLSLDRLVVDELGLSVESGTAKVFSGRVYDLHECRVDDDRVFVVSGIFVHHRVVEEGDRTGSEGDFFEFEVDFLDLGYLDASFEEFGEFRLHLGSAEGDLHGRAVLGIAERVGERFFEGSASEGRRDVVGPTALGHFDYAFHGVVSLSAYGTGLLLSEERLLFDFAHVDDCPVLHERVHGILVLDLVREIFEVVGRDGGDELLEVVGLVFRRDADGVYGSGSGHYGSGEYLELVARDESFGGLGTYRALYDEGGSVGNGGYAELFVGGYVTDDVTRDESGGGRYGERGSRGVRGRSDYEDFLLFAFFLPLEFREVVGNGFGETDGSELASVLLASEPDEGGEERGRSACGGNEFDFRVVVHLEGVVLCGLGGGGRVRSGRRDRSGRVLLCVECHLA